MIDLKPLTQAEIDAVPELKGWTTDDHYLNEPDGRRSHRTTAPYEAITKLVRKLLSAEQEERHPLYAGELITNAGRRELRSACDRSERESGWKDFETPLGWVWLSPAPAPKEPEWQVQIASEVTSVTGEMRTVIYLWRSGNPGSWCYPCESMACVHAKAVNEYVEIPSTADRVYIVTRKG